MLQLLPWLCGSSEGHEGDAVKERALKLGVGVRTMASVSCRVGRSAFAGAWMVGMGALAACQPSHGSAAASSQHEAAVADAPAPSPGEVMSEAAPRVYSAFGSYAPLPDWSGWCGAQPDLAKCAEPLKQAALVQTPESRPKVRAHGWQLWPAIWSPIGGGQATNDASAQRTNLYGTTGCWLQLAGGSAACSGLYPIWMTWPNTGKPYGAAAPLEAAATETAPASPPPTPHGKTLRAKRRSFGAGLAQGDPDPTRTQTVNTKAPVYALPPLAVSKQCGMTPGDVEKKLKGKQYAAIVEACAAAGAPGVFCPPAAADQPPAICDGTAFVNQGDVMIATESLSAEGYEDIQKNAFYDQQVLGKMYAEQNNTISKQIGPKFISTKHMFWPVKGCKPGAKVGEAGCRIRYGALPPWVPKDFRRVSYATNADYLGYERWKSVVAIDTCDGAAAAASPCPPGGAATLELEYVSGARPIVTKKPAVYSPSDFVHVQLSEEALNSHFTPTDRALLDQATIWAYGDESNGFEAGDFLVVAAMHINTKEIASWAFQSVWWSPMSDSLADCPLADFNHCFGQTGGYAATSAPDSAEPNQHSGLSAQQIAAVDQRVGTAWRAHYLLTDSYGINYELDGTKVVAENYFKGKPPEWANVGPSGQPLPLLPVSANVYIEPVIHPLGTDCQNCHRRAGYPGSSCAKGDYSSGCGRTNYQTAQCADLLGDYGAPAQDPCMSTPWAWHGAGGNQCKPVDGTLCTGKDALPVLNTDWIWIIADGHVQKR